MLKQFIYGAIGFIFLVSTGACTQSPEAKSETASKATATKVNIKHLPANQVKGLFAPQIGGYALQGFKEKVKSQAITEFKGTYVLDGGEIKVVVTDWLEGLPSDWQPKLWFNEIKTSTTTIKNFPFVTDRKADKQSILVMVSKRVRIECKSKTIFGDPLNAFAQELDYSIIAALSQKRGD